MRRFLPFAMLLAVGLFAGEPNPLPKPALRIVSLNPFVIAPPVNPVGINEVSVAGFDSVNTALRIDASAGSAWQGAFPNNADQVFTAIWVPAQTAIKVNCVAGCSAGTVTGSGTTNNIPKWTSATALGNSTLTDNGTVVGSTEPFDLATQTAPANPASGNIRLYANSGTGNLACLTSAGGNCLPAGSSGLSGMTANFIPKAATATTITGNSALDDGATVASTITSTEPLNMNTSPMEFTWANNAAATVLHKLVQFTGAPSQVTIAATSSTTAFGVCNANCGNSGSAQIVAIGQAQCVFDNGTTAGDYVGVSTGTAGDCTDLGATYPASGEVIGIVRTTNAGAGTYTADFNPPDLTLPGSQGGGKVKGTLGYVGVFLGNSQIGTSSTSASQQLFWTTGACASGATGCLGIGTNAPSQRLDIEDTNAGNVVQAFLAGVGVTSGGNARFVAENTSASSESAALVLGSSSVGSHQLWILYDPTHSKVAQASWNMGTTFDGSQQAFETDDHRVAITDGCQAIGGQAETNVGLTTFGCTNSTLIASFKGAYTTGAATGAFVRIVNLDATNMNAGLSIGRSDSAANQFRIGTDIATGGTHNFFIANTGFTSGTTNPSVFIDNAGLVYLGPAGSGNVPSGTGQVNFMSSSNVVNDAWNNSGVQTTDAQLATVDNGHGIETAHINLTAQSAAIATGTAFYTTVGTGSFRISWNAKVTTAATTSSTLGGTNGFRVTYTDNDDSVVVTTHCNSGYNSTDAALNTTQAQISGTCTVNAKAATAIQYGFDYTSSGATAMQFALHAKVEAL